MTTIFYEYSLETDELSSSHPYLDIVLNPPIHHLHISYTTDHDFVSYWIKQMDKKLRKKRGPIIVGLDCEWKPMFDPRIYRKVALLQISIHYQILLFHLKYDYSPPFSISKIPELTKLLNTPTRYQLVGNSIAKDLEKLKTDYGIQYSLVSVVELSHAARTKYRNVYSQLFGSDLLEQLENYRWLFQSEKNLQLLHQEGFLPEIQHMDVYQTNSIVKEVKNDLENLLDLLNTFDEKELKFFVNRNGDMTNFKGQRKMPKPNPKFQSMIWRIPKIPSLSKFGLDALSKRHLSIASSEKRAIQLSNWERAPLSEEQIVYAAKDAWVSAIVYELIL